MTLVVGLNNSAYFIKKLFDVIGIAFCIIYLILYAFLAIFCIIHLVLYAFFEIDTQKLKWDFNDFGW